MAKLTLTITDENGYIEKNFSSDGFDIQHAIGLLSVIQMDLYKQIEEKKEGVNNG